MIRSTPRNEPRPGILTPKGLARALWRVVPIHDLELAAATLHNYGVNEDTDVADWYAMCTTTGQKGMWLLLSALHAYTPAGGSVTAEEFRADIEHGDFRKSFLEHELATFATEVLESKEALPPIMHRLIIPAVAMMFEEAYAAH